MRDEAPPLDVAIPGQVHEIMRRCLRKEPNRRWQHKADVKVALDELLELPERAEGPKARARGPLIWLTAIGSVLAAAALGLWYLNRPAPEAPLELAPLTSFMGSELDPRISPDGRQIVYTWDGEKEDNFDIYVQLIGPGTPLRLTTDPADDFSPAWSPDGRMIAFLRDTSQTRRDPTSTKLGTIPKWQVLTVPALGGAERPVAEVTPVWWRNKGFPGPYLTWAPDGKSLVIADRESPQQPLALFSLSIDDGRRRRLTSPPMETYGDNGPAFSPDGRKLAFRRTIANHVADIFVVPLAADLSPAGEPRPMTNHAFAASPSWTPDGREIVFSEGAFGNPRLWRVRANGNGPSRQILAAGEGAEFPSIFGGSPGVPPRLVFYRWSWETNLWRVPVSGKEPAVRLVASTRRNFEPSYSPDGRMIAFGSDRSGRHEIWVCRSDGSQPVQLTTIGKAFQPAWSPDGSQIVFAASGEGQQELYTVRVSEGAPKRLAQAVRPANPFWSRNGKWIYYASFRFPGGEIWKIPAAGGEPVQVTQNPGTFPSESYDGDAMYFWKAGALWRIPAAGGREEMVLAGVTDRYQVGRSSIYVWRPPGTDGKARLQAFELKTGATRTIAEVAHHTFIWGLALSPDERYLLYFRSDQDTSDIMMLENFR